MGLIVPNVKKLTDLQDITGVTGGVTLYAHIFTGSPTIDGSSAIGSFTEVSGDSSYTAQSVASGSWSFALSSDVYTGTATPVTFLFADSHTVNGYWVQNGDGSVLYWSETFASPISVDSSTPLQLTLTISLGMC